MSLTAANEFLNLPAEGPYTADQRALLDFVAILPALRPEAARDGQGRYRLTPPGAGKDRSYTRATTFASACDSEHMLTAWSARMTARGLAAHPDLIQRIIAIADPESKDGKRVLNGLTDRAMTLSGAHINREIGTALHFAAEHWDHGTDLTGIPELYRADLKARAEALAAAGLANRPAEWRERILWIPEFEVAGTTDGFAILDDGTVVVFDDKFGGTMEYSWAKAQVQLALYVNATHMLGPDGWEPMPPVDRTVGYIAHTPAGTGATTVHELDLVEGWAMARDCATVRAAQARSAKATRKGAPVVASFPPTADTGAASPSQAAPVEVDLDRTAWMVTRLRTVKDSNLPQAWEAVRRFWPADTPPPPGPWTSPQVDAIDQMLVNVERLDDIPFPAPDPATESPTLPAYLAPAMPTAPDPGDEPVTLEEFEELRSALSLVDTAHQVAVSRWVTEAKNGGCRWNHGPRTITRRTHAIQAAVIQCARRGGLLDGDDDSLVRLALGEVAGGANVDSYTTGAALGRLTLAEAQRLTTLAAGYQASDDEAVRIISDRLAAQYAAAS